MADLFAYGSLEFPEILAIVAGRHFASVKPAIVSGFRRAMLIGRRYPGILPDASEQTDGVLYLDLDAEAVERVDRFEGDVYARREIRVRCADAREVSAFAYVIKPEHADQLTRIAWDRELFRAQHLADYAIRCQQFANGLHERGPGE